MGCIHSKNQSKEAQLNNIPKISNIYRVSACRVFVESGTIQNGYLELSPKELSFSPLMGETIKWALQHLRRYGCVDDTFSFEAGRRCMSGPGIYTFRCQEAEHMHRLFQSYINSVAKRDESALIFQSDFATSVEMSSFHETYLEPTTSNSIGMYTQEIQTYRDSTQSTPANSNLNSPSLTQDGNLTNEVVHLNTQSYKHMYPKSNIYQEFPVKTNEHNNNIPNRKPTTVDAPPHEIAPNIQNVELEGSHYRKYLINAEDPHMYENVIGGEEPQTPERCYENFSSIELPISLNEKLKATNENDGIVNYITLDLVQSPTSMDSFSLKLKPFNTDSVNSYNVHNKPNAEDFVYRPQKQKDCSRNNLSLGPSRDICSNAAYESSEQHSMGYSTIDFIKTCALLKSVAVNDTNCQESRITRHSASIFKNPTLNE